MFASTLALTTSWILSARTAGATASSKAAAKKQAFRIVLIPSVWMDDTIDHITKDLEANLALHSQALAC